MYPLIANKYNKTLPTFLIFVLVFVWPFGFFFLSMFFYKKKWAKFYICFFFSLFGYSLVASSTSLDLYRYLTFLPYFENIPLSSFFRIISGSYETNLGPTGGVDFYRDVVAFIVSRFTNSGSLLMMTFSFIYGFVVIKSLDFFTHQLNKKATLLAIILILCFFEVLGIRTITGVRFATAAFVFYIGARWILESISRPKGYIIASLSLLIHFSFVLPFFVLIIYNVTNIKRIYLIILLLLSLVVRFSTFDLTNIYSSLIDNTIYSQRMSTYTDENVISNTVEGLQLTVWYVSERINILVYFSYIAILLLMLNQKYISDNSTEKIANYSLLLLSLVNFSAFIPNLNERLSIIYLLFLITYVFNIYVLNAKNIKVKIVAIGVIGFSTFNFLYEIRAVLYYTSPYLYIGNLFSIFTNTSNESVFELLFN